MTGVTVIVGTGRVGLSLARALHRLGDRVRLVSRSAHPGHRDAPDVESDWGPAIAAANLIVIAAPDDVIAVVADRLAATRVLVPGTVVLHCSGLHDRTVLAPLAAQGAHTGSWHPLQSIPVAGDGERFRGVPAVLEGDPEAMAAGRMLAERLHMGPVLELPAAGKARYHAGAVFAANYLVVLCAIAERLAREAGAGDASRGLFLPIMRQVLANLEGASPGEALTGPIRRGDVRSVATHLAALEPSDRETYLVLAREALRLAEAEGLSAEKAEALREMLSR